MPPGDLLEALPGVVVIGTLPGYVLATLIAPNWRRWERLAMAPGLACGFAGILGIVYHDIHIPFELATVLPVFALTAILMLARARWTRRLHGTTVSTTDPPRRAVLAIVVAALGSGAVAVGIAVVGFSGEALPVSDDGSVHAQVAEGIARTHDALPLLPEPASGSANVRPRTGFEAVAAISSELGRTTPTRTLAPLALVSVLLLPLGLALLAMETTGSVRIAILAPIAGVGAVLPLFPFGFAEFPLVADSTLVAPLLVAFVRAVRGHAVPQHLSLVGTVVAAIWVVHGTEILTVAVIAAPLVAGILVGHPDRGLAVRRLAGIVLAGAFAALAVTLLTRLPAVPSPAVGISPPVTSEAEGSVASAPGAGIDYVVNVFRGSDLPGSLGLLLFAAGSAAAIVLRRLRWALVASVVFLCALFDVSHHAWLHDFWVRVYPWGALDRLVSIQYWTAAIIVALGADALITLVDTLGSRIRRSRSYPVATVATGVVGVALLVVGASQTAGILGGVVRDRSRVTQADITVFEEMSRRLPAAAVVLTDGEDDAGIWVSVMTPDVQYLTKSWMSTYPDDERVVALENACRDPARAQRALSGMDAVFVGSKHWRGATHPWDLACIVALPGLVPVASATDGSATATVLGVRH